MTRKPAAARDGYPARLVCLTEETVEVLFDLGAGDLVVGVSTYAVRPDAVKNIPKVSAFTSASIDRIVKLQPDLVLTFSDIQADITRDLVKRGVPVYNFNQRRVEEIYGMVLQVGALIGYQEEAQQLCKRYREHVDAVCDVSATFKKRPKVYFEEWNDPLITGISWVSELITIAGGEEVFPELKSHSLAKDRIVSHQQVIKANPDVVLASWCGKAFDRDSFMQREGYQNIEAVKQGRVFEIDSTLILQPGPAALTEGLDCLCEHIHKYCS